MRSDDDLRNDDSQQLLTPTQRGRAGSPAPKGTSTVVTKRHPPQSFAGRRAEQLLERVESGIELALRDDGRDQSHSKPDVSGARPFQYSEFESPFDHSGRNDRPEVRDDVELDLQIELGRAELLTAEIQSLREGAVVPLDKLASDPVDIVINGRLFARGEVLVLNDCFCVRVAEIVTTDF